MDKQRILSLILSALERELESATKAAREAASEATDEESRPENKYDTRGLETSYLAGAQAHLAKELQEALQAFRALAPRDFAPGDPIAVGALFATLSPAGRELFFLGPAGGGIEVETPEGAVAVVTPRSPLGRSALGKSVGAKLGDGSGRAVAEVS